MSESVLPMFSSRSFIVSGLTFRSLIHFKFIFVYGVRKGDILYWVSLQNKVRRLWWMLLMPCPITSCSSVALLHRFRGRYQLPASRAHSCICFKSPCLRALLRHHHLRGSGLLGDSSCKEPTCQCRRHKRCGFDCWVRKIFCRVW